MTMYQLLGVKINRILISWIAIILKFIIGYISKMVNSRNRINEKIIFLHVSNTEEICGLVHSFLD